MRPKKSYDIAPRKITLQLTFTRELQACNEESLITHPIYNAIDTAATVIQNQTGCSA